jgi:hypothetical protein
MESPGVIWRKSSYSTSHDSGCVEVTHAAAPAVAVRDSRSAAGPRLVLAPGAWRAFVDGVKAGGFSAS